MKIKHIIYGLLTLIALTVFTSCEKDDPVVEQPKRTVLVYMVASNLGPNLQTNIEQMISVATNQNLKGGNLLVFYSKNGKEAELFQIKEGAKGVVTRHHIRDYTDQSAISPDVMREVIHEVFTEFPADSYGMILSSHGTSWLPTNYGNMLRSFGEESGKWMEIYELKEALQNYHFDFLLFDACSMGGIECVYELKDVTDYIVSSPSETMTAGFPYHLVLPYLFEKTPNLEKVAEGFYTFYTTYYNPYGNVSVVKTAGLNELANIVKSITSNRGKEGVLSLSLSNIQVLSYIKSGSTKLYDFSNFINLFATEEQYVAFANSMQKVVMHKFHTSKIFCSGYGYSSEPITVNQFSGLSVYPLQSRFTELNEWYTRLDWYKAVYE